MGFVPNFMRFPAMWPFWKSVKIWQSCREFKGGKFLRHSVEHFHVMLFHVLCIFRQPVVIRRLTQKTGRCFQWSIHLNVFQSTMEATMWTRTRSWTGTWRVVCRARVLQVSLVDGHLADRLSLRWTTDRQLARSDLFRFYFPPFDTDLSVAS